jgi:hypothetical protein
MKSQPTLLPLFGRFDWAIYLLVVGVLMCLAGGELAAVPASKSGVIPIEGAVPLSIVKFNFGLVYSILVLVVVPAAAFVLVNLDAARKFRMRIGSDESVPVVKIKVIRPPAVAEKGKLRSEAAKR